MRAWIRDTLKASLARSGRTLVQTSLLDDEAKTSFTRELLSGVPPDLVLDVGANRGQYRSWMRDRVGYRGRGVSFEPLPDAAEMLRRAAEGDPLWQVQEMALGPSKGRLTLHVTGLEGQMSSALEPDRSQTSALADASRVTDQIDVAMETVDEHLPGDDSTVLLKLDTQGYDLEVLRGAGPRLDEVSILVTELSFTGLYTGQPPASEVLSFLRERDFVLAGLYRTNEVAYPLRMLEGDATFVHRRWAP